ncbi:SCO0607 family lipoprotein [Catenuloplanes sp. NPDC051500]|uniref:SCO0607 family lipoprotein n=1 Tax=Catenuloplanes sp. NPDC051500 TaxID=3363959 RepID=UPI0037933F6B
MRTFSRLLSVLALSTVVLSGCSGQEKICRDGEYPVKAVDSTTGRACAPNGEEPPAGYVRYPDGKVPKHIGDEWDTYWSTRSIDKNGTVTEAG